MKKTVLINQSGAMGDIFCCAPIAQWWKAKGYTIFWPVRYQYFNLVEKYFPYANALMIDQEKIDSYHLRPTGDWLRDDSIHIQTLKHFYDIFLDLADRGDSPQQKEDETFEEYKYRIAKVPYTQKHKLLLSEDIEKQQNLFNKFAVQHADTGYSVAHLSSSHGDRAAIPADEPYPVIEIVPIVGFEIPDWSNVIVHAQNVYCVESAVHQFIDGMGWRRSWGNLYLLSRSRLKPGGSYTKSEHWNKKYMK